MTCDRYDLIARAIHLLSPDDDESSFAHGSRVEYPRLCVPCGTDSLPASSTDAECFLTRHFDRKWPGRKGVEAEFTSTGYRAVLFSATVESATTVIHRHILRIMEPTRIRSGDAGGKRAKHFYLPARLVGENRARRGNKTRLIRT